MNIIWLWFLIGFFVGFLCGFLVVGIAVATLRYIEGGK